MKSWMKKMTEQSGEEKKKIVLEELHPLLKEWMERMRPDLSSEAILKELDKIFPSS